jgi:hypothetical protein
MKVCKECSVSKNDEEFIKSKTKCNICVASYKKQWYEKNKQLLLVKSKENYLKNSEKIKERIKQYHKDNPGLKKEKDKKYYEKNKKEILEKQYLYALKNKDRIKNYKKEYSIKNKEKIKEYRKVNSEKYRKLRNEYDKKRIKEDSLYALTICIRKNILKAFRERLFEKKNSTTSILGCSFEEFKNYLESKFEPWMNWENRGLYNGELNYGWDVDHITPISSAKTEEDVVRLNHYTNLQPLCSYINRAIKGESLSY